MHFDVKSLGHGNYLQELIIQEGWFGFCFAHRNHNICEYRYHAFRKKLVHFDTNMEIQTVEPFELYF